MTKIKNMKITSLGLCFILILTILPTIAAFNIGQSHQKIASTNTEEKYFPSDLSDNEYDGHIRVYVVEIESRWNNNDDEPYHYGYLDFALNEDFSLHNQEDIYNNSIIWESKWAGYPSIELENILVIAAIFNSVENPGYSDPPNGNPFDAYYVDETTATIPKLSNPPKKPSITGPTGGAVGTEYEYTFVTTDPDEDNISYYIEWGDGYIEDWIGPYESGIEVNKSHI